MTREEITITGDAVSDQLTMSRVDFIRLREADRALAVAAEREACAEIAEAWDADHTDTNYGLCIGNAIRARGSK